VADALDPSAPSEQAATWLVGERIHRFVGGKTRQLATGAAILGAAMKSDEPNAAARRQPDWARILSHAVPLRQRWPYGVARSEDLGPPASLSSHAGEPTPHERGRSDVLDVVLDRTHDRYKPPCAHSLAPDVRRRSRKVCIGLLLRSQISQYQLMPPRVITFAFPGCVLIKARKAADICIPRMYGAA
jgi:hypothetical protein